MKILSDFFDFIVRRLFFRRRDLLTSNLVKTWNLDETTKDQLHNDGKGIPYPDIDVNQPLASIFRDKARALKISNQETIEITERPQEVSRTFFNRLYVYRHRNEWLVIKVATWQSDGKTFQEIWPSVIFAEKTKEAAIASAKLYRPIARANYLLRVNWRNSSFHIGRMKKSIKGRGVVSDDMPGVVWPFNSTGSVVPKYRVHWAIYKKAGQAFAVAGEGKEVGFAEAKKASLATIVNSLIADRRIIHGEG